jgi:hypothetical protein
MLIYKEQREGHNLRKELGRERKEEKVSSMIAPGKKQLADFIYSHYSIKSHQFFLSKKNMIANR